MLLICGGSGGTALGTLLRENPALHVEVLGTSSSVDLHERLTHEPDVIVKDLNDGPRSLGHQLKMVRELCGDTYLIVLTFDTSAAMLRRCHAAGADAVFNHPADLESLTKRLEQLAATTAGAP